MAEPSLTTSSSLATSSSVTTLIATRFLRALRLAVVGVTAVVLFCWQLPTVIEYQSRYRPAWIEFAAIAVLGVITLLAAVVVIRDRPWGRLRWPVLAVVLVTCVVATAGVARVDQAGLAHWSWETFGWFAVILLMDLPLPWFASVLAAFFAITLVQMLAKGQTDLRILVGMGTATLLLCGWQFATARAAVALRGTATAASRIAAEEEALRTAELVAEQLHRDRHSRYADLAASAVPLLAGLADGVLDPGDPAVQRACVIEAARMRRLFAESDDVVDPLEHELHACIDLAERRGVAVQFALRGSRPALPRAARRALTEPVIAVLAGASAAARVTVVGVDDRVVVSVVADRAPGSLAGALNSATTNSATTNSATTNSATTNSATTNSATTNSLGTVEVSWLPGGLSGGDGVWLDATWKTG